MTSISSFTICQEGAERPPCPVLSHITELSRHIFAHVLDAWDERLAGRQHILWTWAECDETGDVIGFKVGYEDRPRRFYSWLGGVLPTREGEGIGSALMTAQHDWARAQGYKVVRTHTTNERKRMLALNVRYGFDVIGTVHPRRGGLLRIVMEKDL